MRIAYIAAGAGGMYCGSCIHDNTLAAALLRDGHEVALMPTYTPLRTDEENVSGPRVFYGAINVYLQGLGAPFRHTPRFVERWLDRPSLLSWVSGRLAGSTDARDLGPMTLSVLQGESGRQGKELDRLASWLEEYEPDVVQITNSMLLGLVRELKRRLGVPVVVAVQGEDLFLDQLREPWATRVAEEMRARATEVDAFVAPSHFYARHMGDRLGVGAGRMHVIPLGIRVEGHGLPKRQRGQATTIGYLARIAPEKGLHLLCDAFRKIAVEPGYEGVRLKVAGYLGSRDAPYLQRQVRRIRRAGLEDRFEHVGELALADKIEFLGSLDVLSVPTIYREPKGLFALEAMANGVPVVLPRHGSFPELIEATGGGLLVEPDDVDSLVEGLRLLIDAPERAVELGGRGREAVRRSFTDDLMASATVDLYRSLLGEKPAATGAFATRGDTA